MSRRIGLSKSKLLSLQQCPRRLWLEKHAPELAEPSAEMEAALSIGHDVGETARQVYGRGTGHYVSYDDGIARAIETTHQLMQQPDNAPIFEATFEHEGLVVRADVLDRSQSVPRLVEIKASTGMKEHHVLDCAIQAWTLEQLGVPLRQVTLAHINNAFVYAGDGRYDELFTEVDVTDNARGYFDRVPALIDHARATLAGPEPAIDVGRHCSEPYDCPFFDHCLPAQGEYPVLDLGGSSARNFELIRAGFRDLRNVPEDQLSNGRQRRIWEYTRQGRPFLGPGLREFASALPYPRYYLDFETISFAVPIWAGTRPYEKLPFQWSCHIDTGGGDLAHEGFLDLSGAPPMRACAEQLIAALGSDGPILVYTSFEQQVITGLAARYPDLATPLHQIRERLVDLHGITKTDYYHPDMHGSWSLKVVLPTIAPELSYANLGSVRDGGSAQTAYLEAFHPETPADRRERLQQDLLDYCAQDTLALTRLVRFFAES